MADTSLGINYEQNFDDMILHVFLQNKIFYAYKAPFHQAAGMHAHKYAAHIIPKQLMCLACAIVV